MNTFKKILVPVVLLSLLAACKKDQYYLYNDHALIQFGPATDRIYQVSFDMADTAKLQTFFYDDAAVTQDTVYFDIYTIGGTNKADRPFVLEQVMLDGENNAVAGTHYKAFTDPSLQSLYTIKAGQVHAFVPIVLLRDASLKTDAVKLQFRVKANEQFAEGEVKKLWRRVEITDKLSRPAAWDNSGVLYYWGKYSTVKHSFMVEQTGERWDDEFIKGVMTDYSLITYWRLKLKTLLVNYNNAHPGAPLTDESGEVVVFP